LVSIAIVTVNWNGWRLTRQCVAAVRESSYPDFHIYIVDNHSSDGSLEHLANLGGDVTLIAHGVNAGWSGGNNVGVAHALADGHDFIFLLNNDAVLASAALSILVAGHDRVIARGAKLAPVLGAVERRDDGSFGFVVAGLDAETGMPGWTPGAYRPSQFRAALIPTAYVHGAALFAHRSVFESVGPFDERFFLNFDETDWCFRAARAGHKLRVARDAVIDHQGSATIGGSESPLQTYFMARNRLLFAEKHCTPEQRQALLGRYRVRARQFGAKNPALAEAFRRGAQDYADRLFGDCPPEIRAMHMLQRRPDPSQPPSSRRRRDATNRRNS
jgi:GT2 family glycosyltransferase